MDDMRILMLSWEYPPRIVGGISRVVYELSQQLGQVSQQLGAVSHCLGAPRRAAAGNPWRPGCEVHVVTCWEQGSKEFEKDKNVFVHRVHTFPINACNFVDWVMQLNFAIVEKTIQLEKEQGSFDLIHAHDWVVAYAARVLKHAYSKPLVCTIHSTEFGRNQGLHNEMQRYISSVEWFLTYESRAVICNSSYMKNELRHIFQVPEDKLFVIPNGVNSLRFDGLVKDMVCRRNYACDNEKIVFFIGRMVQEKGAHVLIDAIPQIILKFNDVKFIMSGKGPQLEYLKSKAVSMGIESRIYFTGYVSDEELNRLYKCSDIAVIPSLYEPFGIAALEGMAAKIPVVVSDTGGLSEIVEHKVDGLKAFSGNPNSLADCILELLLNSKLCNTLVNNAEKKVKDHFTWESISRQVKAVYEEAMQRLESVL